MVSYSSNREELWLLPASLILMGHINSTAVADDVDYANRERFPLPEKRNDNELWNIYDKQ